MRGPKPEARSPKPGGRIGRAAARALGAALGLGALTGCTVGQGEGWVTSDRLYVAECWNGAYDLRPDFFAASPFRDTMQIRVQRGSDLAEVSDGVSVLVNEVSTIRASLLGMPITVGLPPGLVAGDPTQEPPLVSLALYLQLSCHNQNAVVYALGGQIVFEELFDGDPNEKSAAEKLTVATFEVDVADPHDAAPGTIDVPDDKRSHLSGYFRFFFERGRPGQPFP